MLFIVIVALLTVVITPEPVQQRRIYLHPKNFSRPTWCLANNCYTLETLIKNETLGEHSNTTLLLLPGIHTIRSNISTIVHITSTANFTLKAANWKEGATINCGGNVGFKLNNVSYVDISGIIFDNCGTSHYLQTTKEDSVAEMFVLAIAHSYHVSINAVTIKYGKGTGLLVRNVYGYFTLSRAIFTMNSVNLDVIIEDELNENLAMQRSKLLILLSLMDTPFTQNHQV